MATQSYGTEKILIQALLLLKGIIRKSSYNQDIKGNFIHLYINCSIVNIRFKEYQQLYYMDRK
jgi:hypothetical protein